MHILLQAHGNHYWIWLTGVRYGVIEVLLYAANIMSAGSSERAAVCPAWLKYLYERIIMWVLSLPCAALCDARCVYVCLVVLPTVMRASASAKHVRGGVRGVSRCCCDLIAFDVRVCVCLCVCVHWRAMTAGRCKGVCVCVLFLCTINGKLMVALCYAQSRSTRTEHFVGVSSVCIQY